ncbi:MAG: hypothetical protein E3J35_09110 [Methanomassiliicoccales archaeon]|nr:MAG: hypothetical protein E3J35_09110 [Methanomassiliicoccales archaeon]
MRRFLPLLVLAVFIFPNVGGVSTLSDPSKVNKILSVEETPQLAPGGKGPILLTLRNPYDNDMTFVNLTASIYLYVSSEETRQVDANWSWSEPYFEEAGTGVKEYTWRIDELLPGAENETDLVLTVITSSNAPHGGLLDQGSFFVRFELEFDYLHDNGTHEHPVMKSRGHFTDEDWEFAKQPPVDENDPNYLGNLNLTHLGVDGLLPDTSFGVLEPFPDWILYALVVAAAVFLVLALLFYLEENPEKWPGLSRRWIRVRSSMKQSKRLSEKKKEKIPRKKV